jgi:ribosome biogenesis GTPase / thiamine phosphate phosphatase
MHGILRKPTSCDPGVDQGSRWRCWARREWASPRTTTSRSLHLLPTGGVLVDNPGVREFQLPDCDDGVKDVFEDVLRIVAECRFSDCGHDREPGCAVRAAIESGELDQRRFASFVKLSEEQTRNAKALEARRERDAKRTNKSAAARKRPGREE